MKSKGGVERPGVVSGSSLAEVGRYNGLFDPMTTRVRYCRNEGTHRTERVVIVTIVCRRQ